MALTEQNLRNVRDELKQLDDERIRVEYSKKALPFATCVVNVTGGLNVATIMRSSNFYAAQKFYYLGRKKFDKRSGVGVWNYISVNYLKTLDEFVELKKQYRIVGVENNVPYKLQSVYKYTPYLNSLYVFGEEGMGLDKEILELCDDLIYIPYTGGATVRSLNVSASAAIVFSEYVRRYNTLSFKAINLARKVFK